MNDRREPNARLSVQFVSKPIVAPFRDGTKCLVRDWVTHFSNVDARVLGTASGADELAGHARVEPVYAADGGFAPALSQNLRAALWLLARSRVDLWHFVFAPNVRSSQVGRTLRFLRRMPVVQTIASPPRSFERPERLLFGDVVVAQSAWTRASFERAFRAAGAYEATDLRVIPPPVPELAEIPEEAVSHVRERLGLTPGAPLFLYPGDLEVSQGAARFASLARRAERELPNAVYVFAYRDKTSEAATHAARLASELGDNVRFEKNVPDIHALVRAATSVVFPVDDLYGKVDLPIVLLEALALGTPVLALDEGPLASLVGASLAPFDVDAWFERLRTLAGNEDERARLAEAGKRACRETYAPRRVAGLYEEIYRELVPPRDPSG